MVVSKNSEVQLRPLLRADGSASFSDHGYSILAAVNGPVDVQRKDELPEEATIDVMVRPAAGVGGIRERHFESIIEKTLRQVILISAHPRTLIQVTLQVMAIPTNGLVPGKLPQAASDLPLLPFLLQAAILALLSTTIPLRTILTATIVAVTPKEGLLCSPSPEDLATATSIHVLAFSSQGRLLVVESEGSFDMDTWDSVMVKAEVICRGSRPDGDVDVDMDSISRDGLEGVMRDSMAREIASDLRWKS